MLLQRGKFNTDSQFNHEKSSKSRDSVWTQPWVLSSSKISKLEMTKLCPIARVDLAFRFMGVTEEKPNKIDCETASH